MADDEQQTLSRREARRARRDDAARRQAQAQIRQFPDPVLKQRAREVEHFDDDLRALVERMIALMHGAQGAGLAAPQIGLLRRLFVYEPDDDAGPVVLINPEIVERSAETELGPEGCLSLEVLLSRGLDVPVERNLALTVRARNVEGEPIELSVEGLEARIIQHENDHLDGVLIIDRTAPEARREAMRALREAPSSAP